MRRQNHRQSRPGDGFHPKHRLGQNFILDEETAKTLAELSLAGPEDCVLEIGPGMGTMTRQLALRCHALLAYEVDTSLEPYLTAALSGLSNAQVRYQDVMEANLAGDCREFAGEHPLRIAANLPYYITADILKKCIHDLPWAASMAFMVQREVALKLMSEPGREGYGPLPILCQQNYTIYPALDLPAEAFDPSPHVDSTFIVLVRRDRPLCPVCDEALFEQMLKKLFLQRRKTLLNGLISQFAMNREEAVEILRQAGLSETVRAEALDIAQLGNLCDILHRQKQGK